MVNKKVFLILILFLCVSSVYAIEIINESIGNNNFVGSYKEILNSTAPQYYIRYKDNENSTYLIIIQEYSLNESDEFNFEGENGLLDVWVRGSAGSLSYGNYTVYLGEKNKEVF